MKSIVLFVLLGFGNLQNEIYSQERDYIFDNIPHFPRKAEMIVISGPPHVPTFYCKVKDKIYLRKKMEIKDGHLQLQWGIGYVESDDSLRIVDFFDNYKLDNLSLFGGDEKTLNNEIAVYYKLKKKLFKPIYRIVKKQQIIYHWGRDDFQPYEGVFTPVGPKFEW